MPATVFSITYWGITGTLAAPLKPAQASAKLRAALQYLAERKLLDELTRLANDTSSLNDFLERHPVVFARLEKSPQSGNASAGLKKRGSTSTCLR